MTINILLKLLLIVVSVFLILWLIASVFKKVNPIKDKNLSASVKEIKDRRSKISFELGIVSTLEYMATLINRTPFRLVGLNYDEYAYLLNRVPVKLYGLRVLHPQELRAVQLLLAIVAAVLATLFLFLNMTMFGMLGIIAIPVSWALPVTLLRLDLKDKDIALLQGFPGLYYIIYYVITQNPRAEVRPLLINYSTSRVGELRRFSEVYLAYIARYGEVVALDYVKQHYKEVGLIVRACYIIQQRLQGEENLDVLANFKTELVTSQKELMRKKFDKICAKARRVIFLIYIILIQVLLSSQAPNVAGIFDVFGAFGGR